MALDQFAVSAPDPLAETYSFSAQVPSNGIQIVNERGQFENTVGVSQGYAMNAFGGGLSNDKPQQSMQVQINPDLLARIDMASMLPQSAPSFGGGIIGDIMGAAKGLGDDISAAAEAINPAQQVQPAPVTAIEHTVQHTWAAPAFGRTM
ncbi:MAG: hypothetical protein GW903_06345 [Alphaproteobacteria bacterium]|nr:hypothetical protein [Alphaproteobacteria bacterium]NCQ88501.1 hypothetical protein [Alphaproteobacteria bacterium]NCT06044.1 hypothetical protein [Alphaproteobacteria bacterium]